MKKLLSLLFLVSLTISVNAATFKWASSAISFGSDKVKKDATAYLIFIGDKTLGSEGYTFDDIIAKTALKSTSTTSMSKISVDPVDSGSNNVGNFVSYVTFTSGTDTYYNVSSSTYTITAAQYQALMNEGTSLADTDFAFSSTVNAKGTPGTIGGGWYAVPEPATGALALAGVALLFRRRKA